PVILRKERDDVESEILPVIRWRSSQRIEVACLLIWSVVGIVPQVAESKAWSRRPSVGVEKPGPREISSEFERVASTDHGHGVAHGPGALVENPRARQAPSWKRHVPVSVDCADRQAPRHGIRCEFVEAPAARADARFV